MSSERPIRVAIVGGGCAGMTAAFELTRPEHAGKFDVTIYQQGWRLGGKGASGRGPCGRIEEHGLHVWMGFYENAFRIMRDAYAELDRDPRACPIATWTDAFSPAEEIGVAHRSGGPWSVWSTVFPPLPGDPGTPLSATSHSDPRHPFSLRGYLVRTAGVLLELFRLAYGPADSAIGRIADATRVGRALRSMVATPLGMADTWLAIAENQLETLATILRAPEHAAIGRRLGDVAGDLGRAIAFLRPRARDDPHRQRAAEVFEVLLTCVVGAIRSGAIVDPEGFDKLDHYDFREFLRDHGASDAAVDSPFVHGLYSLMFAYEDGDSNRPRTAAGQAMRGCLRMFFTYRGSLFWKMSAGMGDIVFAPLYEVLRRRGARVEFFHRLANVKLGVDDRDASRHIEALEFVVQAHTRGSYEPLIDVGGLPCWPAEPDWRQLEDGERLRRDGREFESFWDRRAEAATTLRVGRDFDFVVLAVGLAEIPNVCAEILAIDSRWRRMVANVKTVATQALQLWLREPMAAVGWPAGPVTITAFTPPFDTWADMTHLVPREAWQRRSMPAAIAYFCNVLDDASLDPLLADSDPRARAQELVAENARGFLSRDLPGLWPGMLDDHGDVRCDLCVDWRDNDPERAASSSTADLVGSQFTSANVSPTDRYTLSLPGTPQYRISPLERTYDNLTIAGDWTSCGLNLGCVEAAVMSGMLAAHALGGLPSLEDIVGYDHV